MQNIAFPDIPHLSMIPTMTLTSDLHNQKGSSSHHGYVMSAKIDMFYEEAYNGLVSSVWWS